MAALSVKHLLGIQYLNNEDIELIFKTADNFKDVLNRPIKKVPSLRDLTVANLFFENSTRTRISFELAQKRLSADIINFSASSSSVKKGETLLDTVNNILAMKVDMIVMRHPNPGAPAFFSRHIDARIVNAGDGAHEHPTQALLDCFSLQEKFGSLQGLHVAIVGDILHSRVARSDIHALTTLGVPEVRAIGPHTLLPGGLEQMGVRVFTNMDEGLKGVDVIIMLRLQSERMSGALLPSAQEYFKSYGLTPERLALAKPDAIVMHPGPMNRGVEIDSAVADGPQAVILPQVTFGIAVRMAVMSILAGNQG